MKLSPEKQKKFALTLLVTLGVICGTWFFLIQGLQNKKVSNTKALEENRTKIDALKAEIEKEKKDKAQEVIYDKYIKDLEEKMPPKGNPETWLIQKITDTASKQKLQISNTTVEPIAELSEYRFKDQPYKLVGFRFSFKGEYNQIGKFFEDLENSNPLMEVDDLMIEAGSEIAPHVHSVKMRLSMVTKQ
jgi:Tfp pilus assembly protein PilO